MNTKLSLMQEKKAEMEDQILELVSQILDELELRLLEFCELAGERIFKAHPQISGEFSHQQVQNFKRDLHETARQQIEKIIGILADEDYWLNETTGKKHKDSLRQNLKVWEVIQSLSRALTPVFQSYGYPRRTGPLQSPYPETELRDMDQLPKSDQLRLWVIKYWMALAKYRQYSTDFVKIQQAQSHKDLNEMWNS